MPLTEYSFNAENAVDRIFYGRINIKKASSFLFYEQQGIVKNMIHYLKYRNQEQIGSFLGDWHGSELKEEGMDTIIDVVIPVPLHKRKLRKRGYNQVAAYAKRLAEYLNATYEDGVLRKTANTKTQTKKSRLARWYGNEQLYTLTDPRPVMHKNVLLVDDVITTGATMEICARALQKAKGVSIYLTSMAVVP